jgi:hypothetical protein
VGNKTPPSAAREPASPLRKAWKDRGIGDSALKGAGIGALGASIAAGLYSAGHNLSSKYLRSQLTLPFLLDYSARYGASHAAPGAFAGAGAGALYAALRKPKGAEKRAEACGCAPSLDRAREDRILRAARALYARKKEKVQSQC